LQELNYWFRRWFEDNELSLRVYFETQKTYGALIVDESSADLGIANIIPVGVDADHLSICRPAKPDFRVKQTLALVETIIARQPKPRSQSWMQEILSASDSELPRIRAKLKAALARNPNDTKAREALDYLDHLRPPAAALPKVLYYKGGGLLSILIAATMVASLSVFGSEMHLLRSALVLVHALFEFLKKLFE
jgi:hypothetical protein